MSEQEPASIEDRLAAVERRIDELAEAMLLMAEEIDGAGNAHRQRMRQATHHAMLDIIRQPIYRRPQRRRWF